MSGKRLEERELLLGMSMIWGWFYTFIDGPLAELRIQWKVF